MERKEQTVLIAIGANAVLILLRFILAGVSGSLGLRANAWHSLADIFVMGVVYLGLVIARQENKQFQGIIAKVEHIVALLVSVFIFYMGFEVFSEAIGGEAIELRYVPAAAIGAFLGVIICYFMARYTLFVGQQTNSPSLIAGGYHAKMDMFVSGAVLVGLVGSLFGMGNLDKVAAVIVVIFIFMAAIELFSTNLKALLRGTGVTVAHTEHAKGQGRWVTTGIIFLLIIGYAASGVYYVKWGEEALIRRYGKVVAEKIGPGLHYRWPYPIEKMDVVKVSAVRRVETNQRILLSGDTNLIKVNIAVHYQIYDSKAYLLNVANPEVLMENALRSSIRGVIGERGIDYVLTTGKDEVETSTKEKLQETLKRNRSGIQVVGLQLLDMTPPADVIDAFQDVASAREDKVTYINEAYAYRNALVPEARGEAARTMRESEAYYKEKIQYAEGEADRFLKKLTEYEKSKDITEFRLYMETMEKILPQVNKFLVSGQINTETTDLWFVGKEVKGTVIGQ